MMKSMIQPTNITHSQTIDYIRAVSAILIILYHYTSRYFQKYGGYEWPLVVNWGSAAVITFFILSGYLSAKYFTNNRQVRPQRFLLKRCFRLYPAYWVCMSITATVLLVLFPQNSVTFFEYIVNLTMISTTFGVPFIDGAYWTLAYELKFAVLFAFIISIKWLSFRKLLLLAWVCLSLVSSLWLCGENIIGKICRVCFIVDYGPTFIVGLCLYQMRNNSEDIWFYSMLLGLCIICCILDFSLTNTLFLLVTLVLLWLSPYLDKLRIPRSISTPFVFIAGISYPLYLLHQMIGYALITHLHRWQLNEEVWLLIPIAIVIGLAYVVHKYIEIPASKIL